MARIEEAQRHGGGHRAPGRERLGGGQRTGPVLDEDQRTDEVGHGRLCREDAAGGGVGVERVLLALGGGVARRRAGAIRSLGERDQALLDLRAQLPRLSRVGVAEDPRRDQRLVVWRGPGMAAPAAAAQQRAAAEHRSPATTASSQPPAPSSSPPSLAGVAGRTAR